MGIQYPLVYQDLPELARIYCQQALKLFVCGQGDLAVLTDQEPYPVPLVSLICLVYLDSLVSLVLFN
jgi:hypothetical protein